MHFVIRRNNCQREPVDWRILCSRCNDKTAMEETMRNDQHGQYVAMCGVCGYLYETGIACPLCAFKKQARAYIGHPFREQLIGMGYPMDGQGLPLSAGEKADVVELTKLWELNDERS